MGSDKVVVLFVEGETEKEFYDAVIKRLREINGGRLDCYVNVQVLKGIGNFKKKAERILLKGIMKNEKYKNLSAHVVLCYDTDVFDRDKNRVKINWKGIEKGLKENGAASVSHVKAVKSIEDWFLIDKSGIKNFLGMSKSASISNIRGLEGLQKLFAANGKSYIKGTRCKGLVNALDIGLVLSAMCSQIIPVCKELNIRCGHDGTCSEIGLHIGIGQ